MLLAAAVFAAPTPSKRLLYSSWIDLADSKDIDPSTEDVQRRTKASASNVDTYTKPVYQNNQAVYATDKTRRNGASPPQVNTYSGPVYQTPRLSTPQTRQDVPQGRSNGSDGSVACFYD